MTSAPRSPSSIEQNGPDKTRVRSTTRIPESGRAGFMALVSHPLHALFSTLLTHRAAASLDLILIAHCPFTRIPASYARPSHPARERADTDPPPKAQPAPGNAQ